MILPIYENISSKTVNYLSLPLSIIESNNESSYAYIFNKLVSIYAKKRNILLKNEKSLLVSHCLPFVLWGAIHFRVSLLHNKNNIKEKLINFLKQKKYIYLGVNEEYIPDRSAYKKTYFYHELLIYGYDESLDKFYTIAFNKNLSYVSQMIDSEDIISAYNTNKFKRFSVYNIWRRTRYDLSFMNKRFLKLKLFNYFYPIKNNYGHKAYKCFCNQLLKDYEIGAIDIRSFRTMIDRSVMLSKIKMIGLETNEYIETLINENMEKSKLLMKNAIKYSLTQKKELEPYLIAEINHYSKNELEILKYVFNNI